MRTWKTLIFVVSAVLLTSSHGTPDPDATAGEDKPSRTFAATFEKLYWTNHRMSRIERANPDGSNREILVSTEIIAPWGIEIDRVSRKMFWTDPWANRIRRANLDGTEVEDLVTTGLDRPSGLALDPVRGKMYWTEERGAEICRSNLDGSEIETIVSGLGLPTGIALDPEAGHMYWGDHGTDTICRATLDGNKISVLVTGLPLPLGIALDVAGGRMYWAEGHLDRIQRANLDGSDVENLVYTGTGNASFSAVQDVALDLEAGVMYWTDGGDGCHHIRRARLDGTGAETIVSTKLDHPLGLAILPSSSNRPPGARKSPEVSSEKVNWDFVSRALAGVDGIVVSPLTDPDGLGKKFVGRGKLVMSDETEVILEIRKKVKKGIASWTLKSGKCRLGTLKIRLEVREDTGEVRKTRIVLLQGP